MSVFSTSECGHICMPHVTVETVILLGMGPMEVSYMVFLLKKKKKSHGQRSLSGYNGTRRSKEEQRSEGGLAFVTSVLVPGFLYGNS